MITERCPTCGGEGKLFEQKDVDYFVPREVCPECDGNEWVNILCDECEQPFNNYEWATAIKNWTGGRIDTVYHKRCCEDWKRIE